MPTFDGMHLVGRCLRSLLAQDGELVEVIVVDDGSGDATVDVVSQFPDVRLVRVAHHGVAAARTTGIRLARAPFVGFCDQDDEWLPHKAAHQAAHLRAHPELAGVLCRQEVVLDGVEQPAWLVPDGRGDLGGVLPLSGLFRAEALARVGGLDVALRGNDDFDLLVRLRATGLQLDVLREQLLRRHVHVANTSNTIGSYAPGMLEVLRRHLARSRA